MDAEGEAAGPRRKALVLVVDDERGMLEIYGEILSRLSVEVVAESDPRVAARHLEEGSARDRTIDLVLLDLRMPHLDGHELLQRIRERSGDVPVMVVTGYPSRESAEWCRRFGVRHYIRKPFDPEDLLQRVRNVLHQRPGQGATPPPETSPRPDAPRGE